MWEKDGLFMRLIVSDLYLSCLMGTNQPQLDIHVPVAGSLNPHVYICTMSRSQV
jgi:hypothetical protein